MNFINIIWYPFEAIIAYAFPQHLHPKENNAMSQILDELKSNSLWLLAYIPLCILLIVFTPIVAAIAYSYEALNAQY